MVSSYMTQILTVASKGFYKSTTIETVFQRFSAASVTT